MPAKRLRLLRDCLKEWVLQPPVAGLPGGGAGCIIGLVCRCPDINAEGLRLNNQWVPEYLGVQGWPAIYTFFRLHPSKAHWLFDTYYYPPYTGDGSEKRCPDLQDVLNRLETVLANIDRPSTSCLC